MSRLEKYLKRKILYLFFYFICTGYIMLYTSFAEENYTIEIPKWSFEFNDCSVSEALSKISKSTGVNVLINKDIGNMIHRKYYKDKSIDHIVTDILSREECAIVKRINDKEKLVAIDIWIVDRSNKSGNLRSVATNNPFEVGRIKRNVKHSNRNNPFVNIATDNPFEAGRIERNVKNGNRNNPFVNIATDNPIDVGRIERNVKNGNRNNPFLTQGE